MSNVKRRESTLRRKIAVLLNHDRGAAADRAGVIERFRESVEGLHGNAFCEPVNQTHLKRVVNRVRPGLIEVEAIGVGNLQSVLRVQWAGAQGSAIRRAKKIQIRSLRAGVGQIQNPVLTE